MLDIDSIRINFNAANLFWLNICLAFLLFGVALDLKTSNFKYLLKHPKVVIIGLVSQWIVLPAVTLLLIWMLSPPVSLALGMALIASCPGGNVSNYAVHLAKANAALSVVLTSISTLMATFMTPIYFGIYTVFLAQKEGYNQSLTLNPWDMAKTIIVLIIIPLTIGMLVNHFLPKFTARIKSPVKSLSMIIFLGFVVIALYSNFEHLKSYLHLVFFLVLIHNSAALFSGYSFAKLLGLNTRDSRTISIETGIQNSGLGLILIFNFFDGLGGMAIIAAWWGIWHLISVFFLANLWKSRNSSSLLTKLSK